MSNWTKPEPAFTADELSGVFVSRWYARDMANHFIGYLRPNVRLGGIPENQTFPRPGGYIKVAKRTPTELK